MYSGTSKPRIRWLPVLFLLPAWLFIPYCLYGVPWLANRVSENVFALINAFCTGVILLAFVPLVNGWLAGKYFYWLILLPYAVFFSWVLISMKD